MCTKMSDDGDSRDSISCSWGVGWIEWKWANLGCDTNGGRVGRIFGVQISCEEWEVRSVQAMIGTKDDNSGLFRFSKRD